MLKNVPLYIKIPFITGIAYIIATGYSNDKGFRERFFDYFESNVLSEESEIRIIDSADLFFQEGQYESYSYRKGDWEKYIISPIYRDLGDDEKKTVLYEGNDVVIQSYGSLNLDLTYGKSVFTKKKYQQYYEEKPASLVIDSGFKPSQDFQLHLEGKIGDRMTIYVDHDSRKEDNHYKFQYKALRDNEVIREINAGEIDIKFNHSKYAVYDNESAKGLGVDITLKKNKFQLKAFGSIARGQTEVETFRGNSTPGSVKLSEYQFVKRTYYQIEPYIRYDNVLSPPYPPNYKLQPVNILPVGFEIYMDDQNPQNNYNAIQLSLDGGFYTKLQSGVDYKINFSTGLITFLRDVPRKARVFAVYNLAVGASTDPGAIPPGDPSHPGGIFTGKIFLFIKYGYSIAEEIGNDVNNDGRTNEDIYEVRSFYYIGEKHILPDNLILQFFKETGVMSKADIGSLGPYSIDYTEGIIKFVYREPFIGLLSANTASQIYTENQPVNVYDYSRYKISVDYYREAKSFKLKHFNIIPNSVSIKVDGRVLPESLYTVDYTNGYIMFTNPENPLIGPNTLIEIKYEYQPFEAQTQEFVGGLRGDYRFNKNLNIGASLLYARGGGDEKIPEIGSEPTQTLLLEGDTTINLDGKTLAKFTNLFSKKKLSSIPLELNGYVEYARSYRNINTFGKALIDNMEASEDVIELSLFERDWILSFPVSGGTTRSLLNYYYYRELSNPTLLKGIFYPAPKISYSVKPGPFNIAYGHIPDTILTQGAQSSLALDFDGTGDFVSIATRRLSDEAVDFSGVQYVEITYYYQGNNNVSLQLDAGKINEDSDSDGVFDTEDINYNGILDWDPSGFTEDLGYLFNEAGHTNTRVGSGAGLNSFSRGDGVLNSEDLNGNGILDTGENVYSFQALTLDASTPQWRKDRIYIDHSALTQSEKNVLGQVEAVRLSIVKSDGDAGRVYIDSIRFVSSKWRDPQLDGSSTGPDRLKVSMINNIDDDEYKRESFSLIMADLYKSLYGTKDFNELLKEKETALKLEYDIPASNNNVSITRRLAKPIDIRHYKTLNLWMNFRSFNTGDTVGIVLGSSDSDYVEYQVNMDYPMIWREFRLNLTDNIKNGLFISSATGIPDFKRITFIKIIINSASPPSSGSLWIDEIYVSEPEVLEDSAHWYEGEIKITRPFHVTKTGVPILSDFTVKYIQKGHGANFSTIGKVEQDLSEEYKQVFSSFNILPNWSTSLDFIREDSETDSLNEEVVEDKRGKTTRDSLVFISDYVSDINAVPSLKVMYKYDVYENEVNERIASYDISRLTSRYNHAPMMKMRQSIDNILWGKITSEFSMDMMFKKEEINRLSYQMDLGSLNGLTSPLEIEKRQRTNVLFKVDYSNKYFYIQPSVGADSEEIVEIFGKTELNETEILTSIQGDFHFPFIYYDDFRFVERKKLYALTAGLNESTFVAPAYKIDIQYFENRFRDYTVYDAVSYGFSRSKDARSLVTTGIDIPINFYKKKKLRFIKVFNISYNRSLYLTEFNTPYEGETKGPYEEKFGFNRAVGGITDAGLNIFKYYPFCFYLGRGNFAKGRDYIDGKLNSLIHFDNAEAAIEYDNQLRLLDNFSIKWSMDFNKIVFNANTSLNQICERQNIFGVPNQVVTGMVETELSFDLMKLFDFWFFRDNREGIPYHAAFLSLGYQFQNNMLITANIEENTHTPSMGLTFKWDRSSLGFKLGVDFRQKTNKSFISTNPFKVSYRDYKYYENMPLYNYFREKDMGYNFSVIYETDVVWIFNMFARFYRLVGYPIFTIEYMMKLNRYDYLVTVSPDPYDLHLVSTKLTLDLHKNIQGGISTKFAVEQFRDKEKNYIKKEIFSFELGFNFTLLF